MTADVENSVRVLIQMVTIKIEKQGDGDALLNVALTERKLCSMVRRQQLIIGAEKRRFTASSSSSAPT